MPALAAAAASHLSLGPVRATISSSSSLIASLALLPAMLRPCTLTTVSPDLRRLSCLMPCASGSTAETITTACCVSHGAFLGGNRSSCSLMPRGPLETLKATVKGPSSDSSASTHSGCAAQRLPAPIASPASTSLLPHRPATSGFLLPTRSCSPAATESTGGARALEGGRRLGVARGRGRRRREKADVLLAVQARTRSAVAQGMHR
mmetsp:Transcript_7336/g.18299  ORF Transcript_7336/g.18299 Transcript_7336/m.18299 type:complete len:206 (-) Transcript_7336:89-706(-)